MNAKEYIESEYGTKHLKNVMQLEDETSLFGLMDEYAEWKNKNCNIQNVMLSLLKTAKCPDCDGSGAKIIETTKIGTKWVDDGNGNPLPEPVPELDYDLEQCEWCYHRDMLLSNEA